MIIWKLPQRHPLYGKFSWYIERSGDTYYRYLDLYFIHIRLWKIKG